MLFSSELLPAGIGTILTLKTISNSEIMYNVLLTENLGPNEAKSANSGINEYEMQCKSIKCNFNYS